MASVLLCCEKCKKVCKGTCRKVKRIFKKWDENKEQKQLEEVFKVLASSVSMPEEKPNNTRYVKLVYTRSGVVVLTATDDPAEAISVKELKKYIK